MDKTFDPAAVEQRISALWEQAGAFRAGRAERKDAEPFTIVIPPPNVTGSLHMGHALNNTLQDILCRFERMRGKDVLWQPGTDHAGIATQMVVERQLAERGGNEDRRTMGREKFLEEVWRWKAESGGAIVTQLKRLGASCDWSRERFTMDEGLSRAVVKVFVQLYREGLIYKDKRLVNWDPKLLTAISDLEVVQKEEKGSLWHFRYPLADKTFNADDPSTYIVVATTRPETMLGDTAVAVHPEDERYLEHVKNYQTRTPSNVILPLVGRRIPIIADEYADPVKGTGAVKITPAHDFNDFEVGKRHGLRIINVLDTEAKITVHDNQDFLFGLHFLSGGQGGPLHIGGIYSVPSMSLQEAQLILVVHELEGKPREKARARIVELMSEAGFLDKVEPTQHTVPHGDRSGVVLEPRLTDQWYVDAKILAQPALSAVRERKTQFIPDNWSKTYFQWLDHIQPWCISRQLWWGHQIPAWYGAPKKGDTETRLKIFVTATEGEAIQAACEYYGVTNVAILNEAEESGKGWEFDLAWLVASGAPPKIKRDPDVLDTWFSSALWPFSTLGWPDETPELKRYYPTNVLVTGFDIIFFWVARMMMMGLHFMPDVPFHDVYIHALVRDATGAKMSKSKGNVIDPLGLIDEYGADALRFTLAAMAAQGRDIKLSTQRVEGYRNFATKLWNAARFAEVNKCVYFSTFDPHSVGITVNIWILGETAKAISEVTAAIEAYRFNDAANAAYRFVWNIFCDWYLELAKPLLQSSCEPNVIETRLTTAYVLDAILKLLHPFMPFITEELWAARGFEDQSPTGVLALAEWPKAEDYNPILFKNEEAEAEIGWLVDLISEIRSVRSEINVPAGALIPLVLIRRPQDPHVQVRAMLRKETLERLARLSDISFATEPPQQAVQVIARDTLAALPLAGVIDFAAEKVRLAKEIDKLGAEAKKIDAKLGNADFIARAPEDVVEENRERLAEAQSRIEKLSAALKRLDR